MGANRAERPNAYPRNVRAAAEQLAADPDLSFAEIRRRLISELGVTVTTETVRRWVKERDLKEGAPTVPGLAERTLRLLSQELTRIERSPSKPDLDRVTRIAQILKTLDGLRGRGKQSGSLTSLDVSDPNGSDRQAADAFKQLGAERSDRPQQLSDLAG